MRRDPASSSRPLPTLGLLLACTWATLAWAGGSSGGVGVGITIVRSSAATANDGQLDIQDRNDTRGTLSATPAYPGQTFTFSIVSPPTRGSLVLIDAATGAFSYKADTSFTTGVDSFTFQVVDNHAVVSNTATETLLLKVAARAADRTITTPPNTPVGDSLYATRAFVGEVLTYQVLQLPEVGVFTLTDVNTGAFTYTPPTGFTGNVIIKFRVTDPTGQISNIAVERITVTPTPATAVAGSLSTRRNHAVSGNLSATPSYIGQNLIFRLAKKPGHGKAIITDPASGAFTYTPAKGYLGNDSFKFLVTDQAGTPSNAATVSITVHR